MGINFALKNISVICPDLIQSFFEGGGGGGLRTYRIYSINRPRRLFNFGSMKVGSYSRWATFLENKKTRDNKFVSLQQDKTKYKS